MDQTIWQWFRMIANLTIRKQALTNYKNSILQDGRAGGSRRMVGSMRAAIDAGFVWDESLEGGNYWSALHDQANMLLIN